MIVILLCKAPVLVELPAQEIETPLLSRLKVKVKKFNPLKTLNFESFLEKLLRQIKILSLKTENKVGSQLEKLRQKSVEQEKKLQDGYWQELRVDNQGVQKEEKEDKQNKPG